jgi:F420-dependent oxidoreductase-like protein
MSAFFGYHMPNFTFHDAKGEALFDRVIELAQAAEEAGFDMVTVMDHFYQIGGVGPEEDPMLEAYTTLSAIAARTSRVKVGTLVTGVTYRNPAFLAKTVTTLDTISKGRALLGIGAAWNESEHRGYGYEFSSIGERMRRLDEALTICKLMFTEERPSFEGRYYRIHRALNSPRPIQAGGPKILIGGGGEQKTLRLVARHADMSHWFPMGLDGLRHKNEVLLRHCEAEGRDPSTIMRTIGSPVVLVANEREASSVMERIPPERRAMMTPATPDRAAEIIQEYMREGFTGFTFGNTTLGSREKIELAAELIRLVNKATVASR